MKSNNEIYKNDHNYHSGNYYSFKDPASELSTFDDDLPNTPKTDQGENDIHLSDNEVDGLVKNSNTIGKIP